MAAGVLGLAGDMASADALSQLQTVRATGCDGRGSYQGRLVRLGSLDLAAQSWANGEELGAAMDRSGYTATQVTALHVHGGFDALTGDGKDCHTIRDSALRHIGSYQSGADTWFILAAPAYPGTAPESIWHATPASTPRVNPSPPAARPAAADGGVAPLETAVIDERLPGRVLSLVNAARAKGRHCGGKFFPAVPAVGLSPLLNSVASQHAEDMAQHGYFEHIDLDGRTPAERVKAAGYRERRVGENIAYGPTSPEEVVAGWIASPGHCENIMDPHVGEMGLALALSTARPRRSYWVQLLAEPAILTGLDNPLTSPSALELTLEGGADPWW
ncbi:MAG TPA: CAP domain-containing protein [Steroidobacteraceae bacterium]|nr:CAP domain-containing protein [Steroidobacteraceae bacterium]